MSDSKTSFEAIATSGINATTNMAVAAALELIKADISNSSGNSFNSLEGHLENLSTYVSRIEASLQKRS